MIFWRLGDGRKAILRQTNRAVIPFGGLAVHERLPFVCRSPNAIGAAQILLTFWLSVPADARRFAHVNLVRGDVALRQLLGWRRWPDDDAVRAFFGRLDSFLRVGFVSWRWIVRS